MLVGRQEGVYLHCGARLTRLTTRSFNNRISVQFYDAVNFLSFAIATLMYQYIYLFRKAELYYHSKLVLTLVIYACFTQLIL